MKQRLNKLLAIVLTASLCVPMLPAGTVRAAGSGGVTFTDEETVSISGVGSERSTLINDGWKFYFGNSDTAQETGFNDSSWETVDLPHDFSISQEFTVSGEAESGFLLGGTGWYRKSLTLPESCDGKTIVLNFDGVYKDAYVYVNGTKVGEHHYGYTSFAFDISDYVTCDGATENLIAVRAVHETPSSRWYSGSGIYRDVKLIITDSVHVALNGTQVTTPNLKSSNGTDGMVNVAVDVQNDSASAANVTVRNTVYEKDGTATNATSEITATVPAGNVSTVNAQVAVSSPKLWSVDTPNLYYVRTEILKNGSVVDTYDTEFGFKWYEFVDNTGFKLNGENVKINGVCLHHDQGALGSAAYYDAMYRQLTILKDMGVNTIRATHNPYDEDFVDICNEIGLMVIEEAFDGWTRPKNGNSKDFSAYFTKNLTDDNQVLGGDSTMTWAEFVLKSMIKRDRNDASIILWSLGNEISEGTDGNANWSAVAQNLVTWAKEVDTAHPLTSGSNRRSMTDAVAPVNKLIYDNGGVAGFNYGVISEIETLHNTYPVLLYSETASATTSRSVYVSQASNTSVDGKMHLTSYDTSTVNWGKTAHASMWNVLTRDWIAGECVWTGFDYIGEPTPYNGTDAGSKSGQGAVPNSSYFGIVDTAGFPKDTYYLYRSQWNQDANTLHLVTAWDSDNMMNSNGKTPVWVYSNAPKVELYRDGTKIGTATRTVNRTDAGHVYYTYTTESNDSSICTTASGSGDTSLYSVFNVAYSAGTISAKAFDENGNEITDTCSGKTSVSTPGEVSKLVVAQNQEEIQADGSSLAYISVDVTDANGNLDTTAENEITFSLSGNGEILGVDNGDQATTNKFQQPSVLLSATSAKIKAFSGKALVIVSSTKSAGGFTVTASAEGMEDVSVTVNTTASGDSSENSITSYSLSRHCYVPVGTSSIALPKTTKVTYRDGTTKNLAIAWENYNKANLAKSGSFVINGTIKDGENKIALFITAHVYNPISIIQSYTGITPEKTLPVLPAVLMTYTSDGNAFEEFPVSWNMSNITSDKFVKGAKITINGTVTALGETYPATAVIRVAEPTYGEKINIAPQASNLTSNATGDTLNSIINGVKYAGTKDLSERWSNWPEKSYEEDATITMAWDTAHTVDQINLYYYLEEGTATSQAPTSVAFEYSLDGTNFIPVAYEDATELPTVAGVEENGYSFKLKEVIVPIAVRIVLGHDVDSFIGLTEAEVISTPVSYEANKSAELQGVTIGGVVTKFDTAKTEYVIDAPSLDSIVVENEANAAVTVVKVSEREAKLVVVSEDGKTTKTYTITLKTDPSAVRAEAQRKELSKQIAAAKALDSSLYTPESYAKLQSVIASIEKAMATATESELKALMSQLAAAQSALVKISGTTTPTTPTSPSIKAGDAVTLNKIQYKVVDASAKTVAVAKGTNKKATKVTIPATVKVNGVSCKVVQIGANAFKGYSKLKSVTIGKNVTTIEKKAFYGCKKLSKVTFKGTAVKTIKSGAFKKTSAKMTVKVPKKLKKNKKTLKAFQKKLTKAGMNKKAKIK